MAMIAAVRRALGGAVLLVLLAAPASAHATDSMNNPTQLPINRAQFWNTAPLTIEADEPFTANDPNFVCSQHGTQVAKTGWFEFTGNGGPMWVTTSGSNYDTQISVFEEEPVIDGTTLCSNDRLPNDADSQIFLDTVQGRRYLVQAGGCDDDQFVPTCPFAAQGRSGTLATAIVTNDDRAEAQTIQPADSPVIRTNLGMTTEGSQEPTTCGPVSYGRTVWFRYVAPADGRAVFTTTDPDTDTVMSVYRGTDRIDCNDDAGDTADTARVSVDVTPGVYHVQIGGFGAGENASHGNFTYAVGFTEDLDGDNDGVPRPADCDDNNPSVQSCPTPPAPPQPSPPPATPAPAAPRELNAEATLRARPTGSGIRVRWLRVRAPSGARVVVVCGRRCRFSRNATVASGPRAKAAKTVSFSRLVGRRFRAGTRIRIYVTKAGSIGKYFEYRVRRGNFRKITRCLAPGTATSVTKCP